MMMCNSFESCHDGVEAAKVISSSENHDIFELVLLAQWLPTFLCTMHPHSHVRLNQVTPSSLQPFMFQMSSFRSPVCRIQLHSEVQPTEHPCLTLAYDGRLNRKMQETQKL